MRKQFFELFMPVGKQQRQEAREVQAMFSKTTKANAA